MERLLETLNIITPTARSITSQGEQIVFDNSSFNYSTDNKNKYLIILKNNLNSELGYIYNLSLDTNNNTVTCYFSSYSNDNYLKTLLTSLNTIITTDLSSTVITDSTILEDK